MYASVLLKYLPYFCGMKMTEQLRAFIRMHQNDDVNKLLLSAARYPEIDMPFAVEQLVSRRQIKDKLPSWYANDGLLFPAKIAAEQCSSELTALYKQRLVTSQERLCDLTGGLGIDSYYYSRKAKEVLYLERFESYCQAATYNFNELQADNITVIQTDATVYLDQLEQMDVFYIDPARRGEGDKRVYALQDCEPDLVRLAPSLLQKAPRIIAKISPMADIQHTLQLLPQTTRIHVLSVKNECKELLFELERGGELIEPVITCVNMTANDLDLFSFTFADEREALTPMATQIGPFLYEPNASLLKAGAFKCVAQRMGVSKLHVSSHLYTSDIPVEAFPGRKFAVQEVFSFTGKLCKSISKTIPRANITVRNFPLSVDELRKRTKITDGGDVYLFATTDAAGEKLLIKCTKLM